MAARDKHFPLVDSMRAIAALSILLLHTSGRAGLLAVGSTGSAYLDHLDVGVRIFFVISGFVLFRPFARAHLGGQPDPAVRPYAWRRFLRIVPAYWVALAITAVWIPSMLALRNAPYAFGFAQIYRTQGQAIGIFAAWTLCVEVTFYAFLPLYAMVVGRIVRRRGRWLRVQLGGLVALCVVSFLWKWVWLSGTPSYFDRVARAWLPGWLDLFALGMFLAVIELWCRGRRSLPRPLALIDRFPALAWIVAGLAFWVVATRIGLSPPPPWASWTRAQILNEYYLYAVVAFAIMVPAVLGDPRRGLLRRLLGNRALVWLGVVSYGIYLWQLTWLHQLGDWKLPVGGIGHTAAWLAVGFGGTILLGALSRYVIEVPALSLSRRGPFGRRPAAGGDSHPPALDIPRKPEPAEAPVTPAG